MGESCILEHTHTHTHTPTTAETMYTFSYTYVQRERERERERGRERERERERESQRNTHPTSKQAKNKTHPTKLQLQHIRNTLKHNKSRRGVWNDCGCCCCCRCCSGGNSRCCCCRYCGCVLLATLFAKRRERDTKARNKVGDVCAQSMSVCVVNETHSITTQEEQL